MSHPAWVCGLKLVNQDILLPMTGHTLRGCVDWNLLKCILLNLLLVTPCVGVWIETPNAMISRGLNPSHPAWVCGLKLNTIGVWLILLCHTLRGCVDWNSSLSDNVWETSVTPCVGVWIETQNKTNQTSIDIVTPCVGVWIETEYSCSDASYAVSHPAWVCGLKHLLRTSILVHVCHTLRGCVDWNLPITLDLSLLSVTPCVGVWIETMAQARAAMLNAVTPCVGVWIETLKTKTLMRKSRSHPAWVCGLKQ